SPDLGDIGQSPSQTGGGVDRGQYQSPILERAGRWVQLAAGGNDDEPRRAVPLERLTQGAETGRGSREDVVRRPERAPALGPDGAGADEYGIGKGAEQAHHEPIRLIASADDPTRPSRGARE